jgi:O-antigen ligase
MNSETSSKPILLVAAILGVCICYFAFTHLGSFADINFLGGIFFLQFVLVGFLKFDRIFFPVLMVGFLWAGTRIPLQGVWTKGRWFLLAVGALGGFVMWMKRRHEPFGGFHLVAMLCILSALVSAMVSPLPQMALSKAGSLLLLFLYGASGIRLAVLGREAKFFNGLLLACEAITCATALAYLFLGMRIFGNQNSLGAAIGVGVVPLLLWGWFNSKPGALRRRRFVVLLVSIYLVYYSFSRAAMIAVIIVCLVLCFCLREYKVLVKAALTVVCLIAVVGVVSPAKLDQSTEQFSDAVLYKGHREQGLLGSRQTPWEETVAAIKAHPFFGSGFGTSLTEDEITDSISRFSSTSETNREHGSSYMAIAEWVGLLGLLPFVILLSMVLTLVVRVIVWLRRTRNTNHYAVPLAMVLLAGLIHAGFEDWLFAVGYYLSVFFWSLAFVLVDLVPARMTSPQFSVPAPVRFQQGYAMPLRSR